MRQKTETEKNGNSGRTLSEIAGTLVSMKQYRPIFLGNLLFSAIIYYLLLSRQLVNSNDGLWEYSYYKAGRWSLSLGRWLLLYLDRLHFGISAEPLASLLTLSCYCAGLMFLLDLLGMRRKKAGYLAAILFLSNVVVCSSLTYRFMSLAFGAAFLLNVLAAWVIVKWKNVWLSVVLGGILIAMAMGLYQAYLSCTCIALLGYYLYSLSRSDTTIRSILADVAKAAAAGVLGGILYYVILQIHLAVFHVGLSDYNNANIYSLGNTILNLPVSISRTYQEFFRYFGEKSFLLSILKEARLYYAALALAALCLLCGLIRLLRTDRLKALLYLLFILMVPIACNAVILIATSSYVSILMTPGMALCIPVLLCVIANADLSHSLQWLRRLNILLAGVLVYGGIYQIQIDQHALLEGQNSAVTMAEQILYHLDQEELLNPELEYCIVGIPGYNDLTEVSKIYTMSNMYARFASWYTDPSCSRRSWQGIFSHLCGIHLPMCSSENYGILCADEEVRNMPLYPEKGFIRRVGDIIVIKVSDY